MILLRTLTASAALGFAMLPLASAPSFAEPQVVASIKPVHSLVAAVMEGVGTPDLIVGGAASPHAYALKPSQAQALENADLIFWVGHELESFLEKPIETIGAGARAVELIDSDGVVQLPFRQGGPFEAHDHDDHEGEKHEDHADGHDDHEGEKHEEHAHDDDDHETGKHEDHAHDHDDHESEKHDDHAHDHDDHEGEKHEDHADGHDDHEEEKHEEHAHGHDHEGGFDAHVWLDPVNAKVFVKAIGEALSETDPENASAYAANVVRTSEKLDTLIEEVNATLAPVHDQHFIVFHDAYQYFEKRFDMEAAGSITVNPEVRPSAERVANIREKVRELNASCAFSEPQFDSQLIDVAIEGTDAKSAVLDPLGASIEDGPELYFDMIRNLGTAMHDCLSEG